MLKDQLLRQLEIGGPIEVDGSAVGKIDTAGLQLVLAFVLDCLDRGIDYRWTGRSPELEKAIRTLAIGALLESPGAATCPVDAA